MRPLHAQGRCAPVRRAQRRAASCTDPRAWPSGPHCAPGTARHSSRELTLGQQCAAATEWDGRPPVEHATHPQKGVVLVCRVLHALLVACQSALLRAACLHQQASVLPSLPKQHQWQRRRQVRTAKAGALRRWLALHAFQEPEHGGLTALVRAQRAAHDHQPAVHVAPGLAGQHAPRHARPRRRCERLQARLVDPAVPSCAGLAGHAVGIVLHSAMPPRGVRPDSGQPLQGGGAGRARTTVVSRPSWRARVQDALALTLVTDSMPPF